MERKHKFYLVFASCSLLLPGCNTSSTSSSGDVVSSESTFSSNKAPIDDPTIDKGEVDDLVDEAWWNSAGLKKENDRFYFDDEKSVTVQYRHFTITYENEEKELSKGMYYQKGNITRVYWLKNGEIESDSYYECNCPEGFEYLLSPLPTKEYMDYKQVKGCYVTYDAEYYQTIVSLIREMSVFDEREGYFRDEKKVYYSRVDDTKYNVRVDYGEDESHWHHYVDIVVDSISHKYVSITKTGSNGSEQITFSYDPIDDIALPATTLGEAINSSYYYNTKNLIKNEANDYRFTHRRWYEDQDGSYYVENDFNVKNNSYHLDISRYNVRDGDEYRQNIDSVYYNGTSDFVVLGTIFGFTELYDTTPFLKPVDFISSLTEFFEYANVTGVTDYGEKWFYEDIYAQYLEDDFVKYTRIDEENNKELNYTFRFDENRGVIINYEYQVIDILTRKVEARESFILSQINNAYVKQLSGSTPAWRCMQLAFQGLDAAKEYTIKGATGNETYDGYTIGVSLGSSEDKYYIKPKDGAEYYLKGSKIGDPAYYPEIQRTKLDSDGDPWSSRFTDQETINSLLAPYTELLEPEIARLRSLTINGLNCRFDVTDCQLGRGGIIVNEVGTILVDNVPYHLINPSKVPQSSSITVIDLPEFTIGNETYTATVEPKAINIPK